MSPAEPGGDRACDVRVVSVGQRGGVQAVEVGDGGADEFGIDPGELPGLRDEGVGGWGGEVPQAFDESGRAEGPTSECLAEGRGRGMGQAVLDEAAVGGRRVVAAVLASPGVQERLVGDPGLTSGGLGIAGVAGPLPGFGPGDQAGADGIEVDVAADGPVVGLVLDHLGLVTPLEDVAGPSPTSGEMEGVAGEERLHATREVGPWRPQENVEVVGHEDEGEDHPAGPDDDSLEVIEDAAAVVIVVNDVLACVSARHDVVDGVFVFDAESSWHSSKITGPGLRRRAKNQKQSLTLGSCGRYAPCSPAQFPHGGLFRPNSGRQDSRVQFHCCWLKRASRYHERQNSKKTGASLVDRISPNTTSIAAVIVTMFWSHSLLLGGGLTDLPSDQIRAKNASQESLNHRKKLCEEAQRAFESKDYAKAETLFREALKNCENEHGQNYKEIAELLRSLGYMLTAQSKSGC